MARIAIRHIECPSCQADVGLTRAEVEHRVASCPRCRTRFELRADEVPGALHRSMTVLEARPLLPGPPTGRIQETSEGSGSRLTIRQERGWPPVRDLILLALAVPLEVGAMIILNDPLRVATLPWSRLRGREELWIDGDELRHRSLDGQACSLRRDEVATVEIATDRVIVRARGGKELNVVDPWLGHGPETLAWVAGWIRERLALRPVSVGR